VSESASRRCYDCGETKPIEAFAFANKAQGTRQGRCRSCHAAYRRSHYLRNRATYIRQEVARIRRYRQENRPLLREYLRTHPCVDCGETDIVVLDFDHRGPAQKRHGVTVLALHKSWTRVLEEIAKCDVRCANCHRRRTATQFNWQSKKAANRLGLLPGQIADKELATATTGSKRCGRCGLVKDLSMFPFKNRRAGKRGSICLACMSAYSREHYRLNREEYLRKAHQGRTRSRKRNRAELLAYLEQHPCIDCGESDRLVLEFDHRDRTVKRDDVARLASYATWSDVLAEIEQCDVRCANCHRRKTAQEFNWTKLAG
jgi:hypothetical protein